MARPKKKSDEIAPAQTEITEVTPEDKSMMDEIPVEAVESVPVPTLEPAEEPAEDAPAEEAPVSPTEAETSAPSPEVVSEPAFEKEPTEPAETGDVAAPETEAPTTAEAPENPEAPETEDDGVIQLTLSLPISMFEQSPGSMQRLKAAISSKQTLLKKALGTDSLDVVIEADRVTFPWFKTTEQDSPVEVDAYSKLVFALAKKAITQTRVDPVEKVPEDLQLGMRLYLINLQFKGDEFKSARAVLMKNFRSAGGGNSAGSTKYELTMPEVYKP